MDYSKTTRADGVDGHFTLDDPRVVITEHTLPNPKKPGDDGFWDQFADVVRAVCQAKDRSRYERGVSPALEAIIKRRSDHAAELVHYDKPTDIMLMAVDYVKNAVWTDIGLTGTFTDTLVLLNHLMAWAAHAVSPNSFAIKWHHMVPRPEEVAGAIARDELDAPEHIKLMLFDMIPRESLIADQRTFTMFNEGSPNHPSYVAMHSAAAGAAAAVIRYMLADTNRAEIDMINLTAFNMAFFRTTAGVHYPQDNLAGLALGEHVVRQLLPDKMKDEYGVYKTRSNEILDQTAVDWLST